MLVGIGDGGGGVGMGGLDTKKSNRCSEPLLKQAPEVEVCGIPQGGRSVRQSAALAASISVICARVRAGALGL